MISHFHSWVNISKRNENICPQKDLYVNIHRKLIHNNENLERISITRRMDLKHCEYYSAIKKSHTTDTCKYLDESQTMYWGKKWDTKKLIPCSFLHKKFNNRWKESLVIEIRILVVSKERKFNWKKFWRMMEKFYILIDYLGKYIQQNICLYVPYTFIFKNVFKIMKEKRIIRNWSQWVAMTVEVLLKWRIRKVESCWSMTWGLVRNFLNVYK